MSINNDIENLIRSLPTPVLSLGIIVISIIVFMLISPPHTICDVQKEALVEKQIGNLFKNKKEKKQLPPLLNRAKETCLQGVSSGACFEYFNSLKKLVRDLNEANSECIPELFDQDEIKISVKDGIEVMARLAWGNEPPESPIYKNGWLEEPDVLLFCQLIKLTRKSMDEDSFMSFQKNVLRKFPSERPQKEENFEDLSQKTPSAWDKLGEKEVLNRSLFSDSCIQQSN